MTSQWMVCSLFARIDSENGKEPYQMPPDRLNDLPAHALPLDVQVARGRLIPTLHSLGNDFGRPSNLEQSFQGVTTHPHSVLLSDFRPDFRRPLRAGWPVE